MQSPFCAEVTALKEQRTKDSLSTGRISDMILALVTLHVSCGLAHRGRQ
jgi:hypothetical protein